MKGLKKEIASIGSRRVKSLCSLLASANSEHPGWQIPALSRLSSNRDRCRTRTSLRLTDASWHYWRYLPREVWVQVQEDPLRAEWIQPRPLGLDHWHTDTYINLNEPFLFAQEFYHQIHGVVGHFHSYTHLFIFYSLTYRGVAITKWRSSITIASKAELHPPLLRITTPLLVAGAPILPGRSNLRSTIQDLVRSNLGDVATGVLRRRSDVEVPNFSSWGYQELVKISQDLLPGQVRLVEYRLLKVSVSIFGWCQIPPRNPCGSPGT